MNMVGDLNLAWSNDESLFIFLLMLLLRTDEGGRPSPSPP